MIKKTAVIPAHTVTWYMKGEHCIDSIEGDTFLVRHKGFVPALLRVGQRMRYWWDRLWGTKTALSIYCKVNHCMTALTGGPTATVEQQTFHGGKVADLKDYVDEAYAVVHFTTSTKAQRSTSVAAAKWSVGLTYGILDIVALGLGSFLGGIPLSVGWSTALICSADACLNARPQGLIPDRADQAVMPADWARWVDARLPV